MSTENRYLDIFKANKIFVINHFHHISGENDEHIEMPLYTLKLSSDLVSLWGLVRDIIYSSIPTAPRYSDPEEAFQSAGLGARLKLSKSTLLMNKTKLLVRINYTIPTNGLVADDSIEVTISKKDGAFWKIDSTRKYENMESLEREFKALITYAESVY